MVRQNSFNESPYFALSIVVHGLLILGFYVSTSKSIGFSQLQKAMNQPFVIQAEVNLDKPEKVVEKEILKKVESPSAFSRPVKTVTQESTKTQKKSVTKVKQTSYSVDFTKSQQQAPKELKAFFNALIKEIHSKTKYPRLSKKLRETGIVYVKFTINNKGQVLSSSIKKECDYNRLNKSALDVVSKLEVAMLPPENYQDIEVTFPLSYRL